MGSRCNCFELRVVAGTFLKVNSFNTFVHLMGLGCRLFNYNFYVYFEASMADVHTENALKGLEEVASFLRVLGCYPCNTITI
ncbi:Arogenate dehydratase/prephenate dehydratase 2, chloroplastic [Zea mays]|uniref:Arogenate dehydratase/prephenate dehydratase 2, chloroplastic n=1 Tax=Zea mays TaxID=4577 RepID=A0A3L6F5M8_MAIZE|nr:Arogenate dehydratase/prephenate dehydratase 2, chloroplastic [Zea mays]